LKLDLAKASDRIEWTFISTALHRIGFNEYFINLMCAYIFTSSLAILVNDEPTDYFHPQRGLIQGRPLSPYLFVLAIPRLQETLQNSNLSCVSLGPGAPPIHSMISFCVEKSLWRKLRQSKTFYITFVINLDKLLTFINLPSYLAGMSLTPSKIQSKVYSSFLLSNPT
jgi:hypothetical protein